MKRSTKLFACQMATIAGLGLTGLAVLTMIPSWWGLLGALGLPAGVFAASAFESPIRRAFVVEAEERGRLLAAEAEVECYMRELDKEIQ